MSCFLDKEAEEQPLYTQRRRKKTIPSDDSSSELSGAESDISLEVPLQNTRRSLVKSSRKRPLSSEGNQSTTQASKKKPNAPQANTSASENTNDILLEEIRKTNQILTNLTNRVKRTEKRVKAIEDQVSNCSSSSTDISSTPVKKKVDVPGEVRRETRRIYNMLIEEDIENFEGWKIEPGVTFKDSANQTILNRLIREVKALNAPFLTQHIRDAAYRFYRSRCEEESIKRRGKQSSKNQAKRRHERLHRKLQERKSMLEKGTFESPQQKEEWKEVMKIQLISSDESDLDDENEVIVTKPLPWRSASVSQFFAQLDVKCCQNKSPHARRQMKPRKCGLPSLRPKPQGLPDWVFNN